MLIDLSVLTPKVLIPQPYYPNGDYDLWVRLCTPSGANQSSAGEARFHQSSPSLIEMVKGCNLTAHTDAVYTEMRVYSGIVDPHPWVFALTPFPVVKGDVVYACPSQNGLPLLYINPGLGLITPTASVNSCLVGALPTTVEKALSPEVVTPSGVPSCVKCGKPNEYQSHGYTCWSCREGV